MLVEFDIVEKPTGIQRSVGEYSWLAKAQLIAAGWENRVKANELQKRKNGKES
jgi:hypothetical protein